MSLGKPLSSDADHNPLDGFERVLRSRKMACARPTREALVVDIEGQQGTYQLELHWSEDDEALHCTCTLPCPLPEPARDLAAPILMHMNRTLWLGHFDLDAMGIPSFRYTALFYGAHMHSELDILSELSEIITHSCDQMMPAFRLMAACTAHDNFPRLFDADGGMAPLGLALLETAGKS